MKQLVFVYGTLKKGFFYHDKYLGDGKGEFVSTASVGNDYSLYIDALPFMVREKSDTGVKGELYEVNADTLKNLDDLEGHPIFYKREAIEVKDADGNIKNAWAYIYPSVFDGKSRAFKDSEFI